MVTSPHDVATSESQFTRTEHRQICSFYFAILRYMAVLR